MRYAERSRHVWNIEDIGFWTLNSPILGPELEIEYVEDVKFSFSLEVRETKELTLVFKGTATPTSPCWMALRVSASILTPEREEVFLTSKDVDPFTETSTTLLELFSLDAVGGKCLERGDLTILVRTAELVSIPTQITQEERIPSSKEVRMIRILADDSRLLNPENRVDTIISSEIVRFTNPPPTDYPQHWYKNMYTTFSSLVRVRFTLMDWRGKVRKTKKPESCLSRTEELVRNVPEFIPLSTLNDEDAKENDSIEQENEFCYSYIDPNSHWRGNTSATHCYRHHVVLDSVTLDYRDILTMLMKRDRWTDLNLLTDDGKSFPVHRCVLVVRSKYFEAMLTSNMAEKEKKEILLKDVDSKVLEHLLDFLYSGTIPEDLSVETTVDLYALANYLEVLELCGFCLNHLGREAAELIDFNVEEVFISGTWKELEEEHIRALNDFELRQKSNCELLPAMKKFRTAFRCHTSHSCDNPQ